MGADYYLTLYLYGFSSACTKPLFHFITRRGKGHERKGMRQREREKEKEEKHENEKWRKRK